jgi:glutamine amidotransferase
MVTIIDYDAGNLTSVKRALDHLAVASTITADPAHVRSAERLIFPGVGQARAAMDVLRARGLDGALREAYARGTPILGICIGCQIVLTHSEEDDTPCLGLVEGECVRFRPGDPALKVPHMGWNAVTVTRPHPVLNGVQPGDEFYFVHSYYPRPREPQCICAVAEHGVTFPAAIGRRNLFAAQFHLEKSGPVGLNVLRNFAEWDGAGC